MNAKQSRYMASNDTLHLQRVYSVLLVEDDAITQQRLARIIDAHPRLSMVQMFEDLDTSIGWLRRHTPDVLLTDLGLPDGHGTRLIRAVRRKSARTEIMVMSVFSDERNVISAIEAGATGYLLKDSDAGSIGESIMELIAGGSPISPSIARHLLKRFSPFRSPDTSRKDTRPLLTQRETEVLHSVAKGFSYSEIADVLKVSPHTVTSHIKNIYRKLEVRSRSEAVFEAIQLGLIELQGQRISTLESNP